MMNFGSLGFIGSFFMILWWALIIILFVAVARWIADQFKGGSKNPQSAIDILRERYAKGEIDKNAFDEMKKNI